MREWRKIKEQAEEALAPLAQRSARTRGRPAPEESCPIRTEYERDHQRILYCVDFRRLRHKTQVFFNAQNDHICTRMEHVLYVGSIASTIARALNLNQDLAYAIALGHDLGHAPFGHTGERVLDECARSLDPSLGFEHEAHSLRVVDKLATRRTSGWGPPPDGVEDDAPAAGAGAEGEGGPRERNGLNLTFEVRDGIASHCGEAYDEYCVKADFAKAPGALGAPGQSARAQSPATLEGCVVRLSDKIAYVGRDIEDAIRAGVVRRSDIPKDVLGELGFSNGQIINTLVSDLIENSYGRDAISLSRERGEALRSLIQGNVDTIYRSPRIQEYEKSVSVTMRGLIMGLHEALLRGEDALARADERVLRSLARYVRSKGYGPGDGPARKVVDFVAGMTDGFALQCYEELYWT